MTLNSSGTDFDPPDPVAVLCASGMPSSVAQNVVELLRGAHCLRETRIDYPPVDPGSLVLTELRLTQHYPSVDQLGSQTPGRYGLAVTDGTEITTLLGLLAIATEDVHAQRRAWEEGNPS